MARGNGSLIGVNVAPTVNVASGIWKVSEAEQYLRDDKWPATPTVPGAPTGIAGNGQVSLTWSAPTGGSTPTDYLVQYSSNAGSTWTTFGDGVSTATSATVTGLTNGTGYIFRVVAVNALGQGPYGSASGTITPSEVDPDLLAYWSLNSNANDASPNAYNLSTVGSPTGTTGILSGAYTFGSSNGFSYSSAAPFVSGTQYSLTVNIWVKTTESGAYPYVASVQPEASPYYGWNIRMQPDGVIHCDLRGSNGAVDEVSTPLASASAVNDGDWHMVTLVINISSDMAELWIDGVKEDDVSIAGKTIDAQSGAELTIAYRQSQGSWYWQGSLDEIAIWKKALSSSAISGLYNSGNGVAVV